MPKEPRPFLGRIWLPMPNHQLSVRIHNILCMTRGLTEAKCTKEAMTDWCEKHEARLEAEKAKLT